MQAEMSDEKMELIKENIVSDEASMAPVLSVKKQAHVQTPRQPLMDLKQLGRPAEGPSKIGCGGKLQTPLCTPKVQKTSRKIQPASLVYQEVKEETAMTKETEDTNHLQCEGDNMDVIPEETVSGFVSEVLKKCVDDLQNETKFPDPNNSQDQEESIETLKSVDKSTVSSQNGADEISEDSTSVHALENATKLNSAESPPDATAVSELSVDDLHENSLLGTSVEDDDISLTDSTKTEDELLASYCDTPNIGVTVKEAYISSEMTVIDSRLRTDTREHNPGKEQFGSLGIREQTPRPSFLEKVALMRRVQEASESVGSWVVQRDERNLHLHSGPDYSKPKLVHDVGCSPFPVNMSNTQIVDTNTSIDSKATYISSGEKLDNCEKFHSDADYIEKQAMSDRDTLNEADTDCTRQENTHDCDNAIDNDDKPTEILNESLDCRESIQASNTVVCRSVSIGCSPLVNARTNSTTQSTPRLACKEVGVQSEVVYQSVMCSPIPIPVCDTSAQYDIETQSMMCSPIRFPGCDTQNVAETQSVMCSPMQIPVCDIGVQQDTETQSIMCSPIRVPVFDTSVQNVAETQSVFCSPMVPRPVHDKSVLVSGPELVEAGTSTEPVILYDQSVNVVPDMCSIGTEMDDMPMTNAGTSMTPVKLANKQGKKFTADDIRKQHPRVLANHLDTLMVEKSHLEGQVKNLEKQAKKLAVHEEIVKELEATRSTFEELQRKYDQDVAESRNRYEKLEAEFSIAKLEHNHEVAKLKQEYEETDYRDHFLASQKLVSELQTDLEQYNKLVEDIDQSQKLQVELEEVLSVSWSKVKTAGEKMTAMQHKLDEQVKTFCKQKLENREELDLLEEQKSLLQSQRQEMAEMVSVCKENMLELESKLTQTEEQLQASQERVTSLETTLTSTNKENEDFKTLNTDLSQSLEQLKQSEENLRAEIQDLQNKLAEKELNLHNVTKKLTETQDCKEKEAAENKKAREKMSLAVVNLERTLEMREQDIDSLEKELFECREIIYNQMEANKALEAQQKATALEMKAVRNENISLRDCCAVLRGKEQELKATLESVQEELEGTRDLATNIIKKQGTEIAECFTSLGEVTDDMTTVLENLNRRAGIRKVGLNTSLGSAIDEITELRGLTKTHNKDGYQNSLVSQILNAANSLETPEDVSTKNTSISEQTGLSISTVLEKQNQRDPANQSKDSLNIECGEKSVNQSKDSQRIECEEKSLNQSKNEGSALCSDSSAMVLSNKHWVLDKNRENSLVPQVKKMSELFSEIMRVAHLLEKALKSSLSDIRAENDDLNCRMFQCEYAERRLHAELELRQKELSKSEFTIKQLQSTVNEMGDRYGMALDNQTEIKQQQQEMRTLRGKILRMEGEKELLSEQVTELLQRLETQLGGGQDSRETVALRKEVMKYQQKIERFRTDQIESEAKLAEYTAKAARRMKTLEDNWKKADSEVHRFDELVDVVRKHLVNCELYRHDKGLQELVSMIDGNEPSKKMKKKIEK